jgi:rod shape-determining protein MreC
MSSNIVMKDKSTFLEYTIGSIISPFQIVINKSVDYIGSKWETYFFSKHIYKKYIENKNKIFSLKKENYLLHSKVESLKSQLKTDKIISNQFRVVTQTKVVSINNNFLHSSIMIDTGSNSKIKKNMVVINEDLELVGNITDVITPLTAKVRLITSKTGGVGAYILNEEMEGFLTGNNSDVCSFKYIIESKQVNLGDIILTSGTGGIFPENIKIGKVIKSEKEYLLQTIDIAPFFLKKPINKLIVIEKIK